ncbi:MAG: hypothetical protein KF802_03610 [Bdellovibrionaceae bacterium]|nr:hypothetical protein [Pseudobdellovibrionaceae bacterium]
MKNLKIVTLDAPCRIWTETGVAPLFQSLIGLKLRGYGAEYPSGVLAVDTTDFFATHTIVGFENSQGFHPVMAGKTTTLSRCELHQQNFPGLGLVQAAAAPRHVAAVEGIMRRCRAEGRELAYFGSWTVDPIVRRDRPMIRSLLQLFMGLYHLSHEGIDEILLGGTLRFKTERTFSDLGHRPLSLDGEELPNIRVKHLFGEDVQVMHLREWTTRAREAAEEARPLWENRRVLAPVSVQAERLPRAA